MDDTKETVEETEEVANESSIATFQSEADERAKATRGRRRISSPPS